MSKTQKSSIALLWDESHLWGLMLWRALRHYNVFLQILKCSQIADGVLASQEPAALFVPGGWARRKAEALGERGRKAILEYVNQGGTYIGFCGGAGLALTTPETGPSLNLCPWSRKPFDQRLPNCSGHIKLSLQLKDKLFNGYAHNEILAPVWWPSQFQISPGSDVSTLARYLEPGPDFCVADLPLKNFELTGLPSWEDHYGINLHPEHITQDPCIIQGSYGKGKYILSYTHLETPDSDQANALLAHILKQEAPLAVNVQNLSAVQPWRLTCLQTAWAQPGLLQAKSNFEEIIQAGKQNEQLAWRNDWVLSWKRGIPGFALNTLYALTAQCLNLPPTPRSEYLWSNYQQSFLKNIAEFKDNFIYYLEQENKLDKDYPSSPLLNSSSDLERLRLHLVGPFPGQGGLFADLIAVLDKMLYFQVLNIS